MQILESAEKLFRELYNKRFNDLNMNIISRPVEGNIVREVPTYCLSKGGGTIIKPSEGAQMLNPPANIEVIHSNVESLNILFRAQIQTSELETLVVSKEAFAYAFDQIVNQIIANMEHTVGPASKVRFGKHYLNFEYAKMSNDDDYVIFNFTHLATKCSQ